MTVPPWISLTGGVMELPPTEGFKTGLQKHLDKQVLPKGSELGYMTPQRLSHTLLPQLETADHKSISQFSNQPVALRCVPDAHNSTLSVVLPGLLLCGRQVSNSYQQKRWSEECVGFAHWAPHGGGGLEQLVLLIRTRFPTDSRASKGSHPSLEYSHCSHEWLPLGWCVTNTASTCTCKWRKIQMNIFVTGHLKFASWLL